MIVVNVATRYTRIYFQQNKNNATKLFNEVHKNAERQLGHSLKVIQTYGGGALKPLTLYLVQHGINRHVTRTYTFEHNGIVEHKMNVRSTPSVFLAYSYNEHDYSCLDYDGRVYSCLTYDGRMFNLCKLDQKIILALALTQK